jgi:hypothetical protein
MSSVEVDLYRSLRNEHYPDGTVINEKPAAAVLYPDFEPRLLPSGKRRAADVEVTPDKNRVKAGGGTSLFDRPNVFKSKGWVMFEIPAGTVVPDSLVVRPTGYNTTLRATHYQIESRAELMQIDAFKGALDNLARNAVSRSIEMARRPATSGEGARNASN